MSASTPNAFLNIDDAHLRVTSGNVYAQGLNISGISFSGVSGLQTVTNTGNVTTNTLEFKNGEKAFVATSNVDVKGSLDVANVATIYNGSNADYDQKQKFTSTVSASGNYFSNTLAMSTNGLYAIVGAHGEDKAYTFTRSGSTWTQENIFSSTAGSAFGYAVDISSDGTYAIVGGNGSASVFYRSSGSTWDSGTTLTAGGISVTTGYGASVSISDDGSYAIVGATGQNAAYIFRRTGTTTWDAGVKIALTGFTLGFSVAISGDGLYALLGAHAQHTAYVFKRTGAYIWSQQVKITESDSFGYSVALSTDGSRALIGATGGNGKAYSYERSGSDWSQNAIITASDAASGDAFGSAVSLSSDGSYALVGAPGNEKAYTFKNAGTVWSELGIETASDATAGHVFGRSVSISGDGIYALVGASGNEAAYSYERKETLVLDVRGEANVRTLNVSDDLTSNNLTVAGNLNVTTIRSDSNVVAEYTGPHDRPLRKYPEVALTQNDESATSGYVASGSSRHSASYEYYEAFDLKTNLTDDNAANTGLYGAWLSSDSRFDSNGDADLTTSNTFPGTSYRGEYCALKLPKAIKLDNFHIFPRGDASSYANSNPPKDLRIFGSNDGTTWTHIKQFQNLGFTGRSGLRLHVNDSNTYNEYAFFVEKVTVSSAGVGYCAISGIELYGYEEGSGSLDTTLKSVYNVPATTGTQLEVYYDANKTGNYTLSGSDVINISDLSPQSRDSTATNVTIDSTWNAFRFSGSGSETKIENFTISGGDYVHSISLWFNSDEDYTDITSPDTRKIFFLGADVTSGSAATDGVSALQFTAHDNSGEGYLKWYHWSNDTNYTIKLRKNEWYHVVLIYKGGTSDTQEVYVNNKFIEPLNSGNSSNPISLPTTIDLFLGRGRTASKNAFKGMIANFRLYSKALNAGQVQELYDYQKDYFLGSKSQVTLYKGHLGVGVTEPSGQLELAGDERIQEYPPRAITVLNYHTHIEGHGEFEFSASPSNYTGSTDWDLTKAFENTERAGVGWHGNSTSAPGAYQAVLQYAPAVTSGDGLVESILKDGSVVFGEWVEMHSPYAINVTRLATAPRTNYGNSRGIGKFAILGSNNGIDWEYAGNGAIAPYNPSSSTDAGGYGTYGSETIARVSINSNGHYYTYHRLVVTHIMGHRGASGHPNYNSVASESVNQSYIRFFGTPGPTTLDKGSLTLGRSLDVPRVSRYDVDTETPRPEKLVVDFDTTVNSSPTDISGKGNHGTFYGTDMNYSVADKAFVFNGSDDYIKGSVAGASGQYVHSVSLWYFTNDNPGDDYIYQLGSGGLNQSPSIQLSGTDGKFYVSFIGNYYEIPLSSTVIAQKQWVHLCYSYDGSATTSSSVSVYINGVKMSMTGPLGGSAGTALSLTSTNIHIGKGATVSENVNGKISNFKLYNTVLEPSEVRKLYNLGRTGRSMVISDTAVGIGKAPEAQLDIRGNLKLNGLVMPHIIAGHWTMTGADPSVVQIMVNESNCVTSIANGSGAGYGQNMSGNRGRFTAPVTGLYHFSTSCTQATRSTSGYLGTMTQSGGAIQSSWPFTYAEIFDFRSSDNEEQSYSFSKICKMDAGDNITIQTYGPGYTDNNVIIHGSVHLVYAIPSAAW